MPTRRKIGLKLLFELLQPTLCLASPRSNSCPASRGARFRPSLASERATARGNRTCRAAGQRRHKKKHDKRKKHDACSPATHHGRSPHPWRPSSVPPEPGEPSPLASFCIIQLRCLLFCACLCFSFFFFWGGVLLGFAQPCGSQKQGKHAARPCLGQVTPQLNDPRLLTLPEKRMAAM